MLNEPNVHSPKISLARVKLGEEDAAKFIHEKPLRITEFVRKSDVVLELLGEDLYRGSHAIVAAIDLNASGSPAFASVLEAHQAMTGGRVDNDVVLPTADFPFAAIGLRESNAVVICAPVERRFAPFHEYFYQLKGAMLVLRNRKADQQPVTGGTQNVDFMQT